MLIVRGTVFDIYEPAWMRALNSIGIKTQMFDCHAFLPSGILGRVERRLFEGPGIAAMRKILIAQVKELRPDVVLLYQGHYIDAKTVDALRQYSFVTGYHNDDPFGPRRRMLRYRHLHKAFSHYDAFHVYRPVNLADVKAAGVHRTGIVMPAYLPEIDYPRTVTPDESAAFDCDIFFAGHLEKDGRDLHLLKAIENGLKVKVFGDARSWVRATPALKKHISPVRHIVGDAYRKGISTARISAAFFSKWNRDQYTRRVFEITACRGFLLSERTSQMQALFPEDYAAVYFSSPEEFVEKAAYYCKNEAERLRIAEQGYRHVVEQGHDIYSRMRQWAGDVGKWIGECQ